MYISVSIYIYACITTYLNPPGMIAVHRASELNPRSQTLSPEPKTLNLKSPHSKHEPLLKGSSDLVTRVLSAVAILVSTYNPKRGAYNLAC